jgi:hypothetical protein
LMCAPESLPSGETTIRLTQPPTSRPVRKRRADSDETALSHRRVVAEDEGYGGQGAEDEEGRSGCLGAPDPPVEARVGRLRLGSARRNPAQRRGPALARVRRLAAGRRLGAAFLAAMRSGCLASHSSRTPGARGSKL